METNKNPMQTQPPKKTILWLLGFIVFLFLIGLIFRAGVLNRKNKGQEESLAKVESAQTSPPAPPKPTLDVAAYDKKLKEIANNPQMASSSPTSTAINTLWPVKAPYPNYGALLPFNRIVAYYGNLYSQGMGVLGEYPEDTMLDMLGKEVVKWQTADPNTPVVPALHYIAVVAQAGPSTGGKYIARMPDKEIDKILVMAEKIHPAPFCDNQKTLDNLNSPEIENSKDINSKRCGAGAIVFLDVQVGLSNVRTEIPLLEKYLKLPNVHLGIDPEFAMHNGSRPGTVIGTLDAEDINFVADYLSTLVKQNNLPPKIFIIHRFTKPMVTNAKKIKPNAEVQIVMDMDGFGSRGSKLNTYQQYIYKEPVQFTGFKLFYKNDSVHGKLLGPEELLKLNPIPVYIQYQ